ncbi:MAG TPA: FAD-binding oxidoreductase [Pirellulales bacterium]|nr:FAD-binding oxidoreductase [Pirellulales bacterium]
MQRGQRTLGQTFRRGEAGYETARAATMWNKRLPPRYPDIIVQANDTGDVLAAVRMARRENLRIGVRSGGHSWSGNHVRDGGLLLDVSRLDEVRIDKAAKRATVGPGRAGHELAAQLAKQKLFFPAGHCRGVAVGGYLLQGGYGWHSRVLGPACMSVEAIDVVTADGEVVRASADENADLYWAARGAGPGFFGVVTRFHLRVYDRPKVIGFAAQTFAADMFDEVFRWLHAVGPEVPGGIELQALMSRHTLGVRGAGMIVIAPVFADSYAQAWEWLRFMNRSPLRSKAKFALPFVPSGLKPLYYSVMRHYPENYRYAVDNMWTGAKIDDLLPGLRRIAETLPPAPSHMLWMNWAPPADRPDMAYSMEDNTYIALYSVWQHAQDDAQFDRWPVERMREMEHWASGCQLADENLGQRPARFASDANLARLDRVRSVYDPQARFHSWMGRP